MRLNPNGATGGNLGDTVQPVFGVASAVSVIISCLTGYR